jgi:hypothetical protein
MSEGDRVRFLLDDRLLIDELLVGLHLAADELWTTSYWYHRACRAATLGASGYLSGPFEHLPPEHHDSAVLSLLELPDAIRIDDPRRVVPVMVALSGRHRQLNLLNLEVAASALHLGAIVHLSPPSANGVLPPVLDAEGIEWVVVDSRAAK